MVSEVINCSGSSLFLPSVSVVFVNCVLLNFLLEIELAFQLLG
jgi:hypothetical protein